MELKNLLFIPVFLAAIGFFFYNLRRILSYVKLGQPENRFDNPGERIKNVLKIGLAQSKILREPVAGFIHVSIFWGFLLFLSAIIEAIIQGFYSGFSLHFLGPLFSLITLTQDFLGLFVILAVLWALYRRFVQKVKRLDVEGHKFDAAFILCMIMGVVISMFGQNVANIIYANMQLSEWEVRPVSLWLAGIFVGDGSSASTYYEIFWWMHILIVFTFLNFLPYSKHFHVITSLPNVYFMKIGSQKYALKKLNLEDENLTQYGAADIEHLNWKQLLDGFSCTECGRCTAACPAATTGKQLSPREIIVNIRKRTEDKAPLMIAKTSEDNEEMQKTLVHNYIKDEELWACTTCMACVYECPVTIEHVDSIVDMRRNLVLNESNFPNELNVVFKNLETNGTPWAFNAQDRANWAEGLNIKTMAEDANTEYLFWVGCSGSFDARYQKVSKAFAALMQKANVDFRILGVEEQCNGDTARRLGNEYLAQMMMQANVETLNGYGVKKIVTGCPHCFNSLKNEYPQFGGNFEVLHHTELISQLLNEGKLKLKDESAKTKITYHDSCYLGRYNGVYDSPRDPLKKINGAELIEMERSKDKGFCCGAGGGRMFLEEVEGTRINVNRAEEAVKTNADTVASACPFCMTMMADGIKTLDKAEEVQVKDIAEIVLENIK
ncbi:MAG: Fe-S oxidoreductase [Stygiobacter sp. RIFOXYC12_FULL_38_8]|nr:MAG: Fe-S oxidoreductase [Stygiobacter sp. RIFOXYA12_FULL_38_9]OGV09453.1 MAG: Fe-S oxidoreductase [Stygiobacter sp. RIFOXYB2_FULL_37_11]OGV15319.1 MAG: Fe-S oxidoreductase [Stygiobacter sp. RIFOXYC2_FULL_38_25]OGV30143.1 MAG: Fe-S oxidoreductase [Stygiobacter sp. RIFOXYC12_FULL_38_8]OGV79057.1 MAG: Fe-S oxidoreductase [Stygiobacter sp. GWF2_38_21]